MVVFSSSLKLQKVDTPKSRVDEGCHQVLAPFFLLRPVFLISLKLQKVDTPKSRVDEGYHQVLAPWVLL